MLANLKTLTKEENMTFEELTEEWLLYKKHQIKESSYFRYKYVVDKYINTMLQDIYVRDLEDYDMNQITEVLLQKYHAKNVRNIMIELKSILNYAEKRYMFDFKTDLIILPKTNIKKICILSKEYEDMIRRYCFESKELRDIGLLLCLYTGIRIGEICALTWKDIDLENNFIHINRTIERIYMGNHKTMIYIGDPKSKSSIRTVPIVESLSEILKKLKKECEIEDNMFFLTGSSERFIEPRNYQYWFKSRLKKLNIPLNKFHILRHTFATNCIRIGMDVKSLSEILGHSSVNVTLNRYVHSSYEVQRKYLEKL